MDLLALAERLGVPLSFAVVAVYAFASGKVVARWVYDEMRSERDEWRAVAKSAAEGLEKAGTVADTAVRKVVRQ